MMNWLRIVLVVVAVFAVTSAQAAVVTNGDFEAQADVLTGEGSYTMMDITGWDAVNSGSYNPAPADIAGEAYEGILTVFVSGDGSITQGIGESVSESGDYLVSFATGARSYYGQDQAVTVSLVNYTTSTVMATHSFNFTDPIEGQEVNTWKYRDILLSYSGNTDGIGDALGVRISVVGDQVLIDAVQVVRPVFATNPSPYDGEGLVSIATTLDWNAPLIYTQNGYNV